MSLLRLSAVMPHEPLPLAIAGRTHRVALDTLETVLLGKITCWLLSKSDLFYNGN
jgi:hypothetical protein